MDKWLDDKIDNWKKIINVWLRIEGCDRPWAQMRQQGAMGKLGHGNSGFLTQVMHLIIKNVNFLFSCRHGT